MKTFFQFTPALVCAFSLNAQITAVLNRFPARSPEIVIRNNSTVNLDAFAVSMAPVAQSPADSAPFLFFVDSAVDTDRLRIQSQLPLPPDQGYAVPVNSSLRAGKPLDLFTPPIFIAAVFADGASAGDPALLARLLARRRKMLQAVELARDMLSVAGSHNVPRTQFVEQFRMMADSVSHWYLFPEEQVGRTLYQSIAEKLMDLPPLPVGSAFPPTAFVEQETAILSRQRTRLLESQPRLNTAATVPDPR